MNQKVIAGAKKTDRLTITLGGDQRRQLAALAKERRTSAATIVRWALDEFLAQNQSNGATTKRSKS